MFEVRVFCEDKKLPELLWALDGKIVGMPQLLPVRDAKASKDNTKVVATGEHMSTKRVLYDLVKAHSQGSTITTAQIAAAVVGNGGQKTSAGAYLHMFLKNKVLKRLEKGKYTVTGHFPEHLKNPTKPRKEKANG